MNAIELMNEEHKNILRIIKVVRKVCFNIMKGTEINYKDLEDIIEFIRNYADSHHHKKEEDILFNRITENLGQLGEKLVNGISNAFASVGGDIVNGFTNSMSNYAVPKT